MFVLQDNLLPTTLVFGDDSFVGFLSRLIFDPIPPSLLVLRTAPFLLVAAPKSVILGWLVLSPVRDLLIVERTPRDGRVLAVRLDLGGIGS